MRTGPRINQRRKSFFFHIPIILTVVFLQQPSCWGNDSESSAEPKQIRELRSTHFILHTDLDAIAAKARLSKMESMLRIGINYWGRRSKGQIHCYLVDDLEAWPAKSFPKESTRKLLLLVGG